MNRVIAVIVGVIATFFGIATAPGVAHASAAVPTQAYAYDANHCAIVPPDTTTERGPPRAQLCSDATHDPDGLLPLGSLARSNVPASDSTYEYDHTCQFVQTARGSQTAGRQDGRPVAGLAVVPRSEVAAETAGAATEDSVAGDAAESCLNSFTASTPVTMADGTKEAISKVKVGDKVLATDPQTGVTKAEPVAQLIRHTGTHTMVLIGFAGGSVLDATSGHPVWDATTGAFTQAGSLRVGDLVDTTGGRQLRVASLRRFTADLTAYNLQIGTIHTYYAGTTPVLVHNSCNIGGEAANFSDDELAQFAYQHAGEGDITGRPSLDQISRAMQRGEATRIRDDAVQFDLGNVRVIINESMPWRSTGFVR